VSVATFVLPVVFVLAIPDPLEQPIGVDFELYRSVAIRWLGGGPYVEAYQLAGRYEITAGDVLYPPLALLLFLPFAIAPPAIAWSLWWAIPVVAVTWALVRLRPRAEVWPLLALCVAWPTTLLKTWTGNPVIWSVGALSLGVLYAWPSVGVLLKPSLAPFALFGSNRRSWWLALALLVLLSLPFGSLWLDWARAVMNATGGGILYSVLEAPMLAIPLVAWVGRTREPRKRATEGRQRPLAAPTTVDR
jgi:hypothetical protein